MLSSAALTPFPERKRLLREVVCDAGQRRDTEAIDLLPAVNANRCGAFTVAGQSTPCHHYRPLTALPLRGHNGINPNRRAVFPNMLEARTFEQFLERNI